MTRVGRRTAVAVIAACAAGCATPAWHNVDATHDTTAAFRWDEQQCREANRYRNAHPRWGENPLFPNLVVDEERAAECLKARGWVPASAR